MASNYDITMRQFNGIDYDTLYPKTKLSQIGDLTNYAQINSSGLYLPNGAKSGGILDMNGNRITNLPAPTANSDPSTKEYVDGEDMAVQESLLLKIKNGFSSTKKTVNITYEASSLNWGLTVGGYIEYTFTMPENRLDLHSISSGLIAESSSETTTDLNYGNTVKISIFKNEVLFAEKSYGSVVEEINRQTCCLSIYEFKNLFMSPFIRTGDVVKIRQEVLTVKEQKGTKYLLPSITGTFSGDIYVVPLV